MRQTPSRFIRSFQPPTCWSVLFAPFYFISFCSALEDRTFDFSSDYLSMPIPIFSNKCILSFNSYNVLLLYSFVRFLAADISARLIYFNCKRDHRAEVSVTISIAFSTSDTRFNYRTRFNVAVQCGRCWRFGHVGTFLELDVLYWQTCVSIKKVDNESRNFSNCSTTDICNSRNKQGNFFLLKRQRRYQVNWRDCLFILGILII